MKIGDIVSLNENFEIYPGRNTWKNESLIYDEKAYKILYPERGKEYKVTMVYGTDDKWITLQGINAAFPANLFSTNNQYCKVRNNG